MIFARKMSTMLASSPRVFSSTCTLMSTSSRSTCSVSVKSPTLITQMSLFSCFSICSRTWSSPRVTSVMRDTVGSRVSATERLSMLKPRPLNSPATRARTPNSFSTRIKMMWRISVRPVASEDFHDLVLAGELELLQPLLLHLFVGRQVELLLEEVQLALEVDVLLVVPPELRLSLEQGSDQRLVLFFHTASQLSEKGPYYAAKRAVNAASAAPRPAVARTWVRASRCSHARPPRGVRTRAARRPRRVDDGSRTDGASHGARKRRGRPRRRRRRARTAVRDAPRAPPGRARGPPSGGGAPRRRRRREPHRLRASARRAPRRSCRRARLRRRARGLRASAPRRSAARRRTRAPWRARGRCAGR